MSAVALTDGQKKLMALEAQMAALPQHVFPTRHFQANGLYAREIVIAKGVLLTGKIHKFSQINTISQGDISVMTEDGIKRLQAPCTFVSPAGIKRAGYAHEDTIWTTYCGTEETDLEKLDDALTVTTFEAYIEFCAPKQIEGE